VRPSRFARLARWCATHRLRTIVAWVVLLVAITVFAQSVGTKKISSQRLPGTEAQAAYDLLAAHSPAQNGDTDQFVFRSRNGRLGDPATRARIERALRRADHRPSVGSVAVQVGRGQRIGVASVSYKRGVDHIKTGELQKVEDGLFALRSSDLQVEHGGQGAQLLKFQKGSGPSEGVGILSAAIVLFLTFGSLAAMGFPLITALLALGSAIGGITLISHLVDTPDFATQLATLIGLGVGIDYALFVLTRYRTEVTRGMEPLDAVQTAIDTAGRTVFFAACTVVIALLGLLLLGLSFLHGVAIGAALAVFFTMSAALTLLPAFLRWSDKSLANGIRRKLHIPLPRLLHRGQARISGAEGSRWARWAIGVQRRPWLAGGVSLAILLVLTAPVLGLRLGSSDAGVDPPGSTTRKAYDLVADGFGPGINGPYLLAVKLPERNDRAAAAKVAAAAGRDPGVAGVAKPRVSRDGAVATISAFAKTGPQAAATADTLTRLRDTTLPPVERATGAEVKVGGLTASNEDFTAVVAGKLPLFIGVVVLLSALLLLAVFRSVLIPVKAAAMNLLSIGAALGVVTAIFQNGVLAGPLGIEPGPIEAFIPVLVFAIVFGLSMDYEIFLVSRVHEEWERSGDASGAVASGLATTGKVITAAGTIMVLVFGSFVLGDDRIIKLFGIGLASAILLDALVIRCLLVPALMELFGRASWWLPGWLDRVLPKLALERPAGNEGLGAPAAVGASGRE